MTDALIQSLVRDAERAESALADEIPAACRPPRVRRAARTAAAAATEALPAIMLAPPGMLATRDDRAGLLGADRLRPPPTPPTPPTPDHHEDPMTDSTRPSNLESVVAAARALHNAHLAVGDAAGEWYDSVGDYSDSEDLRRAVEAWRAAGEAFMQAMRGDA